MKTVKRSRAGRVHERLPRLRDAFIEFEDIGHVWRDLNVPFVEDEDEDTIIISTSPRGQFANTVWRLTALLELTGNVKVGPGVGRMSHCPKVAICLMCHDLMVLDLEYQTHDRSWSARTEHVREDLLGRDVRLPILTDLVGRPDAYAPMPERRAKELVRLMAQTYRDHFSREVT